METKTTSSSMTDVAALCTTLVCLTPFSRSHMLKKPLRLLTVRRGAETALSRVLKMKTSVKMCPRLLRVKPRSPRRRITTTNTTTNTGTSVLGAVSRKRTSNQGCPMRRQGSCSLRQACTSTTTSTRASTGRAT